LYLEKNRRFSPKENVLFFTCVKAVCWICGGVPALASGAGVAAIGDHQHPTKYKSSTAKIFLKNNFYIFAL